MERFTDFSLLGFLVLTFLSLTGTSSLYALGDFGKRTIITADTIWFLGTTNNNSATSAKPETLGGFVYFSGSGLF